MTGVRRQVKEHAGMLPGHHHHENHSFEQRNLLQEDVYQPLRITFDAQALDDNVNYTEHIHVIKNELLPRAIDFWSNALRVVPARGNLVLSEEKLDSGMYCGQAEVPQSYTTVGVSDTDLILFISGLGDDDGGLCSSGGTFAVGFVCHRNQFDRPTAGTINVCLNLLDISSAAAIRRNTKVMIHQMAHILGMSSFRYFWDSQTGQPRTPQPSVLAISDSESQELVPPSEDTLQFFVSKNGKQYAAIVTPRVLAVARNQFDCQTLAGAPLEWPIHWNPRFFFTELLSSLNFVSSSVSHLTLALMEDSGWYKANYTMGTTLTWGLSAGCDFVTAPCLTKNDTTTSIPEYSRGYFCSDESQRGCSPDLRHKAACTVIDYGENVPETFRYFADNPKRGGPRETNYCPIYSSAYGDKSIDELDCTNSANAPTFNVYSEVYGENSKCLVTSTGEGRCFRTACHDMKVKVTVRGEWFTCERDFAEFRVLLGGGTPAKITCPRLSAACPNLFCPFNCAGRGACNYENTVNGTIRPRCECFDSNDLSPGCTESLHPNGSSFVDHSTDSPSLEPSSIPSLEPSSVPSLEPSQEPSLERSQEPSLEPTLSPSLAPSIEPTVSPSKSFEPSMYHNSLAPSLDASSIPSSANSPITTEAFVATSAAPDRNNYLVTVATAVYVFVII